MEPILQLRDYTELDYPLLCKWWEAHKIPAPSQTVLPALGIIIEEHRTGKKPKPQAAMFLYMDNSRGVCFLEHAVTTPHLTVARSKVVIGVGIDFLKESAHRMNYGVMLVHTFPSIARFLRCKGFTQGYTNLVELAATTH